MNYDNRTFREELIREIDASGVTSREVAEATGVSKAIIDKLRQRRIESTSVEAAARLARYFGRSVEEMAGLSIGNPEIADIVRLFVRLTPDERELVRAQLKGIAALHRSK